MLASKLIDQNATSLAIYDELLDVERDLPLSELFRISLVFQISVLIFKIFDADLGMVVLLYFDFACAQLYRFIWTPLDTGKTACAVFTPLRFAGTHGDITYRAYVAARFTANASIINGK